MAIWGGVACGASASASVVSLLARTIPLAPFLEGRGKKKFSGGHPQTPAKETVPLWTPLHMVGVALVGTPSRTPPGPPVIARSVRRGNLGWRGVRSRGVPSKRGFVTTVLYLLNEYRQLPYPLTTARLTCGRQRPCRPMLPRLPAHFPHTRIYIRVTTD